MPVQQQTSEAYFKSLSLIFYALIAMQLITAAVLLVLKKTQEFPSRFEEKGDLMIYLLIAVVMVGFVAAYLFYTSRCRALSELKDLKSKMTGYRVTLIIRLAILEALSLMALVLFIITGDLVHIAVAGFVIIYSLKLRPVKSTIARDLNLSSTEQAKLEDPNEIVAEFESQS